MLQAHEDDRLRLIVSNFMVPAARVRAGVRSRWNGIKVLAFDTGGTVLDWHAGLTAAMAAWGAAQGIERDWHALANEHRRRSLRRMTNTIDPGFNIDDVHRDVLGELFDENGLGGSAQERQGDSGALAPA